MKRAVVAVGALLLGAGAVLADQKLAVEQDNLMRAQAKSVYVVMLKMAQAGYGPWTAFATAFAVALTLGTLINRLVERPAGEAIIGWWRGHRERAVPVEGTPSQA